MGDDSYDSFIIDWETLSTAPDATVLSLAYIPFNWGDEDDFSDLVDRALYWKFKWMGGVQSNRSLETHVLQFWEKQPKEVMNDQMFDDPEERITLKELVDDLVVIANESHEKDTLAFCRGQDFDFPILKDIIRSDGRFDPNMLYSFWNATDIRSYLGGLLGDPTIRYVDTLYKCKGFIKHNPVHDCAKSIVDIQEALIIHNRNKGANYVY